ncbi:hypothetical protein M011DRAFT_407868 [Sporormia fimetaria CBS 119925]|uniref:Sin3 binding protein-domain-containing protein n=1 Tax=Sporormia fimetaria CBS 119925 TaxID=1340428 RepID=A0A6A6V4N2_9PLEO|nr:hypothetical protein M011DRAFT_407868 [Sporormia fimetaria CBS 119925]
MAAVATTRPVSNIAAAFAAQASSAHIAIHRSSGSAPASDHRSMLLTPPNSISPTLRALKPRPGVRAAEVRPLQPDSDVDLQDAVEHARAQDLPSSALSREALAGLEAAGQITPAMLAKHHLPKIFMGHGSMPVRDIMAHLAQSVPGYSRIPPAKARRLVVAALEHRAGGGLHGEVVFEKVGWGRWHVKGQRAESGKGVPIAKGAQHGGLTPPPSVDSAVGGLAVPRWRQQAEGYSGSWAAGSMEDSRDDEDMADDMSLDGSESSDSDGSDMDIDMDDQTDDEDWSALDPQSLRTDTRGHRLEYRDYNYLSRSTGAHYMRSSSSQSAPRSRAARTATPGFLHPTSAARGHTGSALPSHAFSGVLGTTSEREAAEALVAMGSM